MSEHDVIEGDALAVMSTLPSDSCHAMLTDPPYGITFMGKEWDHGVPSASVWREALRALKPGAFALVACGTRTQHRMVTNLEDAGFEVRDIIAWLYGSGFPKSHDVSKAIDKAAGDAERWSGYATALKPAMELWTLVRKPTDGTVAANALAHGCGALNIDGCRVPVEGAPGGRWPANVIHDGSAEATAGFPAKAGASGRASGPTAGTLGTRGIYGAAKGGDGHQSPFHGDRGSAARFFYAAKASRREREAGLEGARNPHLTVKPIALTTYLARLLLPPAGGRMLVPFAGVGSEMVGAALAGWPESVGIEIDPEYARIARARIRHWTSRAPLFGEDPA